MAAIPLTLDSKKTREIRAPGVDGPPGGRMLQCGSDMAPPDRRPRGSSRDRRSHPPRPGTGRRSRLFPAVRPQRHDVHPCFVSSVLAGRSPQDSRAPQGARWWMPTGGPFVGHRPTCPHEEPDGVCTVPGLPECPVALSRDCRLVRGEVRRGTRWADQPVHLHQQERCGATAQAPAGPTGPSTRSRRDESGSQVAGAEGWGSGVGVDPKRETGRRPSTRKRGNPRRATTVGPCHGSVGTVDRGGATRQPLDPDSAVVGTPVHGSGTRRRRRPTGANGTGRHGQRLPHSEYGIP